MDRINTFLAAANEGLFDKIKVERAKNIEASNRRGTIAKWQYSNEDLKDIYNTAMKAVKANIGKLGAQYKKHVDLDPDPRSKAMFLNGETKNLVIMTFDTNEIWNTENAGNTFEYVYAAKQKAMDTQIKPLFSTICEQIMAAFKAKKLPVITDFNETDDNVVCIELYLNQPDHRFNDWDIF